MRAPLEGIRVLDLATPRAELAGRLLADLGAGVLKIEPPGGADARRLPPFDDRDASRSLFWEFTGAGKSSRVVDLRTPAGRSELRDLAAGADVLIESFDCGTMAEWGLDYANLVAINPRLVYLSVTPYGQWGPKSRWPATDLTIEAAGGRLALQGDRDRPPLPIGYPQASLQAGAQGAADIVIALNERAMSGLGQYLDLSMQEVMFWTLMGVQGAAICTGTDPPGSGDDRGAPHLGGMSLVPTQLPCADGYVAVVLGAVNGRGEGLISFVARDVALRGELDGDLAGIDWGRWPRLLQDAAITEDQLLRAIDLVRRFVAAQTKHDLTRWALANDLRLGPYFDTADVLRDEHFQARRFIVDVSGTKHPGPWARLSRTPLVTARPPPAWNAGSGTSWKPRSGPAGDPSGPTSRGDAFAGVRVADFTWVAAGPTITKALADHGAEVVKLESMNRPDLSRTLPPHFDGKPGPNRSYWMCLYGTSKRSLACDLSTAEGRELAGRVVDWADVVVESFSPGTMERFGFDYATLARTRPDLIMLSTSLLGQTGPLARFAGYGQQGAGFAALHAITGWPDRAPSGVFGPYTDVIAPKFGIAALGAALLERRSSGLGQHIDLAQVEASLYLVAPLLLDQSVNGRTATACGLDSATACPNGVYAVAGIERYLAIAVETVDQWRALKTVVPLQTFDDIRFDALTERRGVSAEIDRAIATWVRHRERHEVERRLVDAGVPAAVVQRVTDIHGDPQFVAREFKQILPHAEVGEVEIWGFPTRFSAKPVMVPRAPPCFGEHTAYVLRELLRLDEATIEQYARGGVFN